MKKHLFFFIFSMLSLTFCSKGTRIKNPDDTSVVEFSVQGTNGFSYGLTSLYELLSINPNLNMIGSSGTQLGTLVLSSAKIVLSEIKIRNSLSTESTDSELVGPYIVDLLTGESTPRFSSVGLTPDSYDQIKMKLDKLEEGDLENNPDLGISASDPLVGNSLRITGSYSGATASGSVTSMPLTFEFDFDEEFEKNSSTGNAMGIAGEATISVIVAFRLSRWFTMTNPVTNPTGLDISDLTPQSGSLILNKDSSGVESQLRQVIKENVKKSADFGIDVDNSGYLESDEDTDGSSTENENEWED